MEPLPDEPATPEVPAGTKLPRNLTIELKSLPLELADVVAAHLWAAGNLIDDDPDLAYRHAEAARRRAARLPVTREATAETAYAAGLYEAALAQYRALRRMTGSDDYLPVMADCLRALGRFRDALDLVAEGLSLDLAPAMAVELVIVEAGTRVDMGQPEEGLRVLRAEIERPKYRHPRLAQARLLYAYGDLMAKGNDRAEAYKAFAAAASLDPDGTTSALERLDEFDGVTFEVDESEFEDEPEDQVEPELEDEPEDQAEPESDDEAEFEDNPDAVDNPEMGDDQETDDNLATDDDPANEEEPSTEAGETQPTPDDDLPEPTTAQPELATGDALLGSDTGEDEA